MSHMLLLTPRAPTCGAKHLIAETGGSGHRGVRGKWPHVSHANQNPHHTGGDREGPAAFRRSRSDAAGTRALGNRRAYEPVYLPLERRHTGRWPSELPRRPARKWTLVNPRQEEGEPDAALHPLCCVY